MPLQALQVVSIFLTSMEQWRPFQEALFQLAHSFEASILKEYLTDLWSSLLMSDLHGIKLGLILDSSGNRFIAAGCEALFLTELM